MLFLGTVPSPSNLAELRALGLAAATCERVPQHALVIKFAVAPGTAIGPVQLDDKYLESEG